MTNSNPNMLSESLDIAGSKSFNLIIEFHGNWAHGHPNFYNEADLHRRSGIITFKQVYDKTINREDKILKLGYKLLIIWESEWKKFTTSEKRIFLMNAINKIDINYINLIHQSSTDSKLRRLI